MSTTPPITQHPTFILYYCMSATPPITQHPTSILYYCMSTTPPITYIILFSDRQTNEHSTNTLANYSHFSSN